MKTTLVVVLALFALPGLAQDASEQAGIDAEAGIAAPSPVSPADEAAAVAALAPAVNTSREGGPVVIDRLDLGTTSITGNQELPKVLYIVPWKRSDLGDLIGRPVNTLLDEVLAPVDPDVFERHLSYYETLHGETQEE
jgi:hypothetical protein